ncbi:TetR/AcrR family transcriptional regulator [Mycobacterium kyorinense]|uniref:TetR family transcriptional regulator n=1 Tax=Mycobacterium kyorinense TaxID=487514 RepID=A0A1X1XLW0_9MYCO|nr:TetR/AcrR family transcriptional regulator [Mycobacterium kyorinense]ORV99760.1 TetR family transcriptional regulator [Mycobacterium kyorinense]
MTRVQDKPSAREAQRLQTRQRILGAAVAEFKRSGLAGADVGAIVSAAGVAHGTFFFHFPTKEHVLLEVEGREEARMATELARFLAKPHDLAATLTEVVRLVAGLEKRLGDLLFKDFLALHFSSTRPPNEEWSDHPLIVLVVAEIERARDRGETYPEVDAFSSAVFFLLGLYAVLTTTHHMTSIRDDLLEKFVASTFRGLEAR